LIFRISNSGGLGFNLFDTLFTSLLAAGSVTFDVPSAQLIAPYKSFVFGTNATRAGGTRVMLDDILTIAPALYLVDDLQLCQRHR
jgi:hypothetical protein